MRRLKGMAVILAAVLAAGCERWTGPEAAPGPATAEAVPVTDLDRFQGRPYAEFAAAHAQRFSAEALRLSEADAARLDRAMARSSGDMLEGGGVHALVFRGCAETGCADGAGVVAIDRATGAAFVGVQDGAGKHVLSPNERLEALLRLNHPARDWLDSGLSASLEGSPSTGAARP